MTKDRVTRLVDAYFNRPREEYIFILSSIKREGGLTEDDIKSIESRLPWIHAETIVRQARLVPSRAAGH